MPRPARFAHVVLWTYDLPRMVEWYQRTFDLEIVTQSERAVIATYDEEHHRFAFTKRPGPRPENPTPNPLKHIAFAYDSFGDLMAQYKQMRDYGDSPTECVNHGPTMSLYYEDPEGNGVEFFVDKFKTMAESKEYMNSASFKKNLFGYHFDPDQALEKLEAGLADADIWEYDQEAADRYLAERAKASV